MSLQTPRVLPSHLQAFHPSSGGHQRINTVRILGTVTALRGDTAVVTCGSHGDVTLLLQPDSHLQMGKLFEIVGKVVQLDGGQVRKNKQKKRILRS
jgi:Replication factor A protein 3